jgi:hypothetical protein
MKRERQWWRDDLTPAQRAGLIYLRDETENGGAYAGNIRRMVRLTTLRALHRLGLVVGDRGDIFQEGTFVMLTKHGRDSISDVAPRKKAGDTP